MSGVVAQSAAAAFGLEVFRNGTREPNSIPMDLPVGPDYVVGPAMASRLICGVVFPEIYRVVDREGRVSLPESVQSSSADARSAKSAVVQQLLRRNIVTSRRKCRYPDCAPFACT